MIGALQDLLVLHNQRQLTERALRAGQVLGPLR